ncbi:hypothetical protein OUZ56_027785 [Daphnia magna]|uniref:Uncharacterized protein n=1 Tax=Daphnia magna TaxID=35525 RepID=A0ABR0B217_9CRUS|nr:hypothetical protein OUZ56_027785 [Daphnia magna]
MIGLDSFGLFTSLPIRILSPNRANSRTKGHILSSFGFAAVWWDWLPTQQPFKGRRNNNVIYTHQAGIFYANYKAPRRIGHTRLGGNRPNFPKTH